MLMAWLAACSAFAAEATKNSGLPLPRFASLRSGEVNVRSGPGVRYPVDWVFVYRNMPVEIVAEFDSWRKIRDWEGTEGWVHQSMLSGRRTAMVTGGLRELHAEPTVDAPVIAKIDGRVIGRVLRCREAWCRVEVTSLRGWLRRDHVWGIYEHERID